MMIKIKCAIFTLFSVGVAILLPSIAFGAYNNITFPSGTSVVMTGLNPNVTVSISAGANLNNMVVNPTSIVFTLEKDGSGTSSVTVTSSAGNSLIASGGIVQTCSGNTSSIVAAGPTSVGTSTVTVTPQTGIYCPVLVGSIVLPPGGGSYTTPSTTSNPPTSTTTTTAPTPTPIIPTTPTSSTQTTTTNVSTSPKTTTTPTQTSYVFTRSLDLGNRGDDVLNLQKLLVQLGFLTATPSGYYGSSTKSAVMKFQKAHGLSPIGSVGPATRTALNQSQGTQSSSNTTSSPKTTTTPTQTSYVFTRSLDLGNRGDDVLNLQKLLVQLGFLTATPSGYYGSSTKSAVMKFQKAHGLSPIGSVGPATRTALNQSQGT